MKFMERATGVRLVYVIKLIGEVKIGFFNFPTDLCLDFSNGEREK